MTYQLKTRQICLAIIAFIPINKLFVVPSILAKFSAEDMYLSAFISVFLDFITLLTALYISKKTNKTFFCLLEESLGKIGSKIVLFFYFIYFFLKAILPINEQKAYVELTLYTLMPTVTYFLPFFLVAFYICVQKLRAFGRCADILWIITLVGFITLVALSVSNADFSSLLPIGANGLGNIVKGSFSVLNWFGDSAYLLFLIGQFNYEKHSGTKIISSYALSSVMIILFMMLFYSVFTSVAHRQRFALTEISKYTTVINNIGRFDYIGILFLLFSNMFAISIPLFLSCKIFNHIFQLKNKYIAPSIIISLQFLILIFLHERLRSIELCMMRAGGFFFLVMGNILPLLLPLVFKRSIKNEIKRYN